MSPRLYSREYNISETSKLPIMPLQLGPITLEERLVCLRDWRTIKPLLEEAAVHEKKRELTAFEKWNEIADLNPSISDALEKAKSCTTPDTLTDNACRCLKALRRTLYSEYVRSAFQEYLDAVREPENEMKLEDEMKLQQDEMNLLEKDLEMGGCFSKCVKT